MNELKPDIPKGPSGAPKTDAPRPDNKTAEESTPAEPSFLRKNWIIITLIVVVIILICVIIWMMVGTGQSNSSGPPKRQAPQRHPNQQPARPTQAPKREEPTPEPTVETPEEDEAEAPDVAEEPTHEDLINNKDLTADIKVERVPIPPLEDDEDDDDPTSKIIEIHD
ncbi:hypothetical protein BNJ_00391 [Kaumoebavirus]|uniref:hypothetical protein n=1 Tax=Kaumoebavirus TaxID=1859492 RepID=UPI0009C1CA19|nr:hypothetical protein BNJ_00391 [Kaumoebavirus]ARA72210.1 hypothetical protein BNJ_00391 [Kaumoebavirus]